MNNMKKPKISGGLKLFRKCLMMYMFLGSFVKIVRATGYSCQASKETVQVVVDCPDSGEKWREAAARKNCSAYASQCDEPQKLVYHCVINAYVNQTLEVCAYWKFIVHGHCAEYSYGGNKIQENYETNCTVFTQKPCPIGYQSTDAYKYPGCYKLTKKKTVSTLSTTDASLMNNRTQAPEASSTGPGLQHAILGLLIIVLCLLVIFVIMVIIISWFRWKNKMCFGKEKDGVNNREMSSMLPSNERVNPETGITRTCCPF